MQSPKITLSNEVRNRTTFTERGYLKQRKNDCMLCLIKSGKMVAVFLFLQTWAKIFNYVRDPKDLLSCYQTCRTFRALLYTRSTDWMAPVVLQILMERLSLNQEDMKKLRQVSRTWRECIDGLLQGENYEAAYNDINEVNE